MTKSPCKCNFRPYAGISTIALLNKELHSNVNFALPSSNKDQLKDFQSFLNQKFITAINFLDGSTLGNNLITSHQVDYPKTKSIL